jgi:glucosamine 6-phosphate synthetase-like amidotransferase/phosphosugar isomerase protein|tara:strand:+ start:2230 stop:2907 length:678 start_codon:yes stop_codon:yes gene_type:complete
MCAIFGSFDTSMFEVLYQANKKRGNFASSIVSISNDDQFIKKKQGDINYDKYTHEPSCKYYLGHVQAPTSSTRKWSYDTSHPFESLSWLVSHNGVLTNHKKLKHTYCKYLENNVDTAVIVSLLEHFTQKEHDRGKVVVNPVTIIKKALELLAGTYALSIVHCDTNEIFLARSGSILHYNNKGDFSSISGCTFKELPEGIIMRLNNKTKRWNKVSKFKHDSPFSFI